MTTQFSSETSTFSGKLSYKYQRLRERLRKAVQAGELPSRLPGERELARLYGANAKTINKALNDLAMEGLLVRHIGRGTFIAGSDPAEAKSAKTRRNFGWLTPAAENHSHHREMFAQAVELLHRKGHRLTQLRVVTNAAGELVDEVLNTSAMRQMDGLVLFSSRPSGEFLANLRRRHMPVVIANNHHKQIKMPVVVSDYSHGAFSLGEHLIALGHSRIVLLLSPELLPAAAATETGYRAVMTRYGLQPRAALAVTPGFDWRSLLKADDRPTALMCVGAALTAEASDQAAEAGYVQPAMLSISSLPEPGDGRMVERSITAYEIDPELILHWITELLLSADVTQAPEMVVVPGRLIDRGSAVPPMSGTQPLTKSPESAVI